MFRGRSHDDPWDQLGHDQPPLPHLAPSSPSPILKAIKDMADQLGRSDSLLSHAKSGPSPRVVHTVLKQDQKIRGVARPPRPLLVSVPPMLPGTRETKVKFSPHWMRKRIKTVCTEIKERCRVPLHIHALGSSTVFPWAGYHVLLGRAGNNWV